MTDTAEIAGDDGARSTTTTLALRTSSRASVSAVEVMLSPEAVPRMVSLRAAFACAAQGIGELLISFEFWRNVGAGFTRDLCTDFAEP